MKTLLIWTCVFAASLYQIDNAVCSPSDSLLRVIKQSRGEQKVDALNSLSRHLFSSSIDSSFHFSRQALNRAEKLNYAEGKCQAFKNLGIAYYYIADFDSSIYYSLRGLKIAKSLKDLSLQAAFLSNIGMVYSYTARYDEALKYYRESLRADSLLNNMEGIGSTLMNISVIRINQNQYGDAIEMLRKALYIAQHSDDYKKLSNVYHNLGLVYDLISDYEKAIHYYLLALKIEEENDDKLGLSTTFGNIGAVFLDWENYDKALEFFHKSLEMAESTGQTSSVFYARLNLGYIYDYLGDYERAIEQFNYANTSIHVNEMDPTLAALYLNKGITFKNLHQYDSAGYYYQKALEIREALDDQEKTSRVYSNMGQLMYVQKNTSKSIEYFIKSNDLSTDYKTIAENYRFLSKIFDERNDIEKAYEYYKKSVVLYDSVFSQEKHKQIFELQIQYETEKKEQQIESLEMINEAKAKELKLTRLIFGLAIVVVLGVIFSGAILFHNKQLRSKQLMLLTEHKLLRSQMNPHFIFNSLSAIQSYILKNKSLEAGSFLSRFAKLMRSILDNSSTEFILLEEEIETLENYLNLQKLRLQNKLEYNIQADESLLTNEISLPPMLSQPFIENSIEHGILKKESAEGKIDIRFIDMEDKINIEISDNGIGREKANELGKNNHRSRATEITQSRIALLSKTFKVKPRINIVDLYDDNNDPSGTKVIISLPKLFL